MEEPTKTRRDKVPKATKEEIVESLGGDDNGEGEKKPPLSRFMPLLVPLVVALLVSYIVVSVVAVPKGDYNNAVVSLSNRMAAIETSIEEVETELGTIVTSIQGLDIVDQEELNSLAAGLNNLEAQVAGLNIPSESSLIATIDSRIAQYEARLDDIDDVLDELIAVVEKAEEEEKEEALDTEVRWYPQIHCTNYGESTVEVDLAEVYISPTHIEEADDYTIVIPLLNHTVEVKDNVIISVIFAPRSGSRVAVNEDEIYLDSVYAPFTPFTMDVVERSDGTCRRIVFTSGRIRIDAGTPGEAEGEVTPERLELHLEFTLAYE